jgi:hypothetical protein
MVDATAIKSSVKQIAGLLVPEAVVQGIETPFQVMFDPSNKEISDSSDPNPPRSLQESAMALAVVQSCASNMFSISRGDIYMKPWFSASNILGFLADVRLNQPRVNQVWDRWFCPELGIPLK